MSVRGTVVAVVAVGLLVSVAACEDGGSGGPGGPSSGTNGDGGGGSSGGPVGPGAPAAAGSGGDFCQKTLGVLVSALDACCTPADKVTDDYKFIGGIASALLPVCTETLEASITKKRVLYRAAQGDACYAAYQATYAPGKCENITQTYSDPAGTACREAFVGVGEAGAPCAGDHECVDGLTCVGYTNAADGACKAPPAIGEDCGPGRSEAGSSGTGTLEFGTHPSCAAGARCDVFDRKCVKAAASGEDCTSTEDCAASLSCVLGKCGSSGPGGAGAKCLQGDDCTPDLFCEGAAPPTQGTCAKKKPAGGTCTGGAFVTECAGRCDADPGKTGTCATFCGSL